ncbi:conserved hypothetical protein [Theileria orientalis strain Shintoku]|uniref:Uncharacterized protein n=1 Tax=Theileria orientalis strain Shintoku TaxID=869250 RepID=J4D8J7_THEOR|nr:conserved hypothetical protein [Theileria orientalis strain Shintoku]BAM40805.1 conserved hypothetical protein [Theileria orientalis strain Shintoku]|eukprot:XP_009691106.1 conserved hypothetical protein [Theileria orientalis strain Shintoku]
MKLPFLLNTVSQCSSPKEVEEVFNKVLRALPSLDGNTVSNCLNILSKKEINHPKVYWSRTAEVLTEKCTKNINNNTVLSNYEVRQVCIILNAFAKVDHLSAKLIEESTKIITKQIRDLHTRDISNVIHSLGKLNQISPLTKIINKLFKLGEHRDNDYEKIVKTIEECNEQDFSMLLRVFLLNSENLELDKITKKLLKSISDKYDHLSDQTLAILANALANYGRDDSKTLSVLAPIITHRLRRGHFTPQCVAQISNGYAKLKNREEELFTAVSERVVRDAGMFSARCISNVLNAFSKLSIFKRELFMASMPQLENNVEAMTPQCIGNVINSYSKFVKEFEPQVLISFFNKLIEALLKWEDFGAFIGQNYANILNGVSKLHMRVSTRGNIEDPRVREEGVIGVDMEPGSDDASAPDNGVAAVEAGDIGVSDDDTADVGTGDVKTIIGSKHEELKVYALFRKLSNPITKIVDDLNHLDVLLIANSMSRCRVLDESLLRRLLVKLKAHGKKYKTPEKVNTINTLSILYECVSRQNYISISDRELTMSNNTTDMRVTPEQIPETKIEEEIRRYYWYFIEDFFAHQENIEHIRGLDIKLLFNSFSRCNMNMREYCDALVDKYIQLGQTSTRDLTQIVNHYGNLQMEMPTQLQEYIVRHHGGKSERTQRGESQETTRESISQVNEPIRV